MAARREKCRCSFDAIASPRPVVSNIFRVLTVFFWGGGVRCVFCIDLRTNSDYFPMQHWQTGFYNRDGKCLLRGTAWVFKHISGYVFRMNLKTKSYYFPIRHWLNSFYNSDCLLRGTAWVFKYISGYVFCMDLKTKSYYFPLQHWLNSFYNSHCLLRGTDWVFKYKPG
jgi:hypothetical protein